MQEVNIRKISQWRRTLKWVNHRQQNTYTEERAILISRVSFKKASDSPRINMDARKTQNSTNYR